MKNQVILDFCIWGFEDVTPDYFSNILNIVPVKVYIKGQRRNSNLLPLTKKNGWRMSSSLGPHTSFEDQMNKMLDVLEPKIEIIKSLSKKYYCEFSCTLYVYINSEESTPSIHLNERYNIFIREVNVEFDIDLILVSS